MREPPQTSDTGLVPRVAPGEYAKTDEEALHRGARTVRVAILSERALSVGVSQRDDAACVRRARERGIPIVRRSTGGLGIWHAPGDIAWSLVLPRTDPRVGRDFSRAYARLGTAPVRLLKELGASAMWLPPSGPSSEYCLLAGRGAVLKVGGRALGGAAQHLTQDALLHHGVLPYQLEPTPLEELFDLDRPTVDGTLTSLNRVVPGLEPPELARRLRSALEAEAGPTRG